MSDQQPPPDPYNPQQPSSYPPPPASQQPPLGYQQPPPGYGYAPPRNSGKAVTALVLALVSFILCGIFTSIPAFFVGRSAVKDIDRSQGAITGRGLATAAWIIALVNIIITVLAVALFAVLFANGTCTSTSTDDSFSFNCN